MAAPEVIEAMQNGNSAALPVVSEIPELVSDMPLPLYITTPMGSCDVIALFSALICIVRTAW